MTRRTSLTVSCLTVSCLTVSCLIHLAAAPAGGSSAADDDTATAGVRFYSEGNDSFVPAPVLASLVHLEVTGIVARGKVTQIFYNPTDEWLSGVYLFPLPENAAVDGLRMRVGERVLEARIAERAEARTLYEEARETGVKASLLVQQRADVFTVSVAQVGPGEEVEVELDLQFEVRYDDRRFRLRFPLLVAERYKPQGGGCAPELAAPELAEPELAAPALPVPSILPAGDQPANPVALLVELSNGYRLASVTSPTHPIRVVERSGFAYAVELADELAAADGDFVLQWAPAAGDQPQADIATEKRDDGYYYALLTVLPPGDPAAARLPRETIFVVDTSGSMSGTAIDQAKRALALALDDLEPFDRFNVIRFASRTERLFPEAVAADTDTVGAARLWISKLEIQGGTEMLPALAAALQGGRGGDAAGAGAPLRQVIFVTDGQVENEQAFFTYLRRHLGASRLFTVGIGSAPNGHFMRRAAELGRGSFTFISDLNEVERRITALLRKLTAPVLTDLEVRWDDPTAQSWPRQPGDLYMGEPLVVAARLSRPNGEVRLSGQRGEQYWELTIPLDGAVAGVGIGKLWARRRVVALLQPPVGEEAEGDPDEVRRRIVELALAHRLVTRYTSLVALDDSPTAPPGQVAAERLLPVHSPRGRQPAVQNRRLRHPGGEDLSDMDLELTEELVVTSERPLIDPTAISPASTWALDDLETIPVSRDPWSLVAQAPGVSADRRPGTGAADPPSFSGRGAASDQNVVRLDGFEITEDSSGESSFELGQLRPLEVEVTSGGGGAGPSTPGLRVDLRLRDGTNSWRGSGRYTGAGDSGAELGALGSGNRLRRLSAAELELGGPLLRDRLWLWGTHSRTASERGVMGGRQVDSELEHTAGKLHTASADSSLVASWHRGAAAEDGRGAGLDRTPAATWDHHSRTRLLQLEAYHIAGSNLVFTAGYGELERRLDDLPLGGLGGEVIVDRSGVAGGTTFATAGERETEEWELGGKLYFELGGAANDLELGVRWRRHGAADTWTGGTPTAIEAGESFYFGPGASADGRAVLSGWHDSTGQTDLEHRVAWIQDELVVGRLTFILGLRWDRQQGTNRVAMSAGGTLRPAAAEWRSLMPRLGLTWALDEERRTLLRAAHGRFTSRLGPVLASRLSTGFPRRGTNGGFPIADLELFTDTDGDLVLDLEENASRLPWYTVRPDLLAADLRPEITDRSLLGVEHEFRLGLVVGLTLTHRRTHDLLERRTLVRKTTGAGSADTFYQATASDWLPAGTLTGRLPGGESYTVSYFDLRPGLELASSGLWVNGDRRQETRSASLTWSGRIGERWRTSGHFSWSDARRYLGPEFVRFDDPTDTFGSGDDDGGLVVEIGAPDGPGTAEHAVNSRWTFHGSAGVELPWDLDLGIALNGREGHPLLYFRRVARERAGIAGVELSDAGAVRAPDVVTLDLRLAKELTLGDLGITFGLEAFNLLNAVDVLRRGLDLGVGLGGAAGEVTVPRVWRFGVRLAWR